MTEPREAATPEGWGVRRARLWHRFGPPARPSPGEVAIHRRFLAEGAAAGARLVRVLGCTPELRSACGRLGIEALCVDRDPAVFSELARLVDHPGVERFHAGNWVHDMGPSADATVGDGALNMVAPGDREPFVATMAAATGPGERVLLRVHLREAPVFAAPEEVFAWARQRSGPIVPATRTHLDMLLLDPYSGTLDLAQVHATVRDLHRRGLVTDDELQAYERVAAVDGLCIHYLTRERLEELVGDCFEVCSVEWADDYEAASQHPLVALRRRG